MQNPIILAVAVTFFYNRVRLVYLDKASSHFAELADRVHVHIVTNTHDEEERDSIRSVMRDKGVTFSIHAPTLLGHPFLLPWCHFDIFRELFVRDASITHFMYLEDDILVTAKNMEYWLKGRDELRAFGLIPSFLRYEKAHDGVLYITDVIKREAFQSMPKAWVHEGYCYINMAYPYQGMYLLDRELMEEHLTSRSSNPECNKWAIREAAAQGLTFMHVPDGYYSRNLVGYKAKERQIDPVCLIHHIPNKYVNDRHSVYGKISYGDLVEDIEPGTSHS